MSQTPPQDPVDLVQTDNAGPSTINTERTLSPNPTSNQEDPPATSTKRVLSTTPTPSQEDPPISHQPGAVAHEPSEDTSTQRRSSSLPAVPSSKTDIQSEAPTNTQVDPYGESPQTDQTRLLHEDQELGNSRESLEPYEWAKLEEQFDAAMSKCAMQEEGIQKEFNELLNLFRTYTATGSVHEETRAVKRLRTRMTYVQQREKTLEETRTHYVRVVTAFENALALLSGH